MSCALSEGRSAPLHVRVVFNSELPGVVCAVRDGVHVEAGGWFIIQTAEGERLGRIARFELPVLRPFGDRTAGSVLRRATDEEIDRGRQLAWREHELLEYFRRRARELNLPMRPISAVFPLDRDDAYVSFAAEERVDFRELLRELGRRVHRRVDLRQVGVRDQARLSGGWGPCGRALCCSTFMTRFSSVTIRMAKSQNVSLNPSRISGMCGRLMCCLAHEAAKPQGQRGAGGE
jgi:cell fate regulator YaaT (PSP1 superfamily)